MVMGGEGKFVVYRKHLHLVEDQTSARPAKSTL
jgi:hypothetical protein